MATRTPDEAAAAEEARRAYEAARRSQHPRFRKAIVADARLTAARRGDPVGAESRADTLRLIVRLMGVSDAYFAQVCYRAKVSLQVRGIPVLPRVLHRLAMMSAQVTIGDPVLVEAGVYFPHGQVVIDGMVNIGSGTTISPWVTVGLVVGNVKGPDIGRNVRIGTGAKLLGPITVGRDARIGANAVVVHDVAPGTTVVGVPARAVGS